VLWLACPPNSGWREFGAEVVLLCGASGLVNLVPFLQLDGYFIVNHALGAANLRTDSYRFCRAVATRLLGRPSTELRAISTRKRWTYGLYGLASVAYGCWLFYRFVWYAYYVAQDAARSTGVLVALVAFVGLLLLLGGLDRRRRRAARAGLGVPAPAARGEAPDHVS
jgi:putative peptide zinc metalloprotease protein